MPRASTKTLKRVLKKAGLKTTGRKAALTRRARKARLMRGGNNSFVIQVDLVEGNEGFGAGNVRPEVVAANSQQIIQWYRNIALPDEEYMIDPVMTHLNGDRFRVDYQPGERREDLEAEYETFANPDNNGNYPITINGVEYLVMGEVVEGAQGGRRRRRH